MSNFTRNVFSTKPVDQQWMTYLESTSTYSNLSESENTALTAHRDAQERINAMRESANVVSSSFSNGINSLCEQLEGDSERLSNGLYQLNSSISGSFDNLQDTLSDNFDCLQASLGDGFYKIQDTLKRGFTGMVQQVKNLSEKFDQWGNEFNKNQQLQLQSQRIQIMQNENIALLLRIPDFQKERQDYIEKGFKFFANGLIDSDMYEHSLEYLGKAYDLERTDYIVLYHLGMIHLYVPQFLDLEKAKSYFEKAGKLAAVESDPKASRIFNILSGDVGAALSSQTSDQNAIKKLTADSYYFAGQSCYLQGKYAESIEMLDKAIKTNPDYKDANFLKAKTLCLLNSDDSAVHILQKLIEEEPFTSVKTVADPDLSSSKEVASLLVSLRDEVNREMTNKMEELRNYLLSNSKAMKDFKIIEGLLSKNTYLDGLEAKKLYNTLTYHWFFGTRGFENYITEEYQTLCINRNKILARLADPMKSVQSEQLQELFSHIAGLLKTGDHELFEKALAKLGRITEDLSIEEWVEVDTRQYNLRKIISNLESEQLEAENELNLLYEQRQTIENKVKNLSTDMDLVDTHIRELPGGLKGILNKSKIADLEKKRSNLNSDIQNCKEELNTISDTITMKYNKKENEVDEVLEKSRSTYSLWEKRINDLYETVTAVGAAAEKKT